MMLVEQTNVPLAALPLEAFKEHLRLGSGFADDGIQDGVLESCLRAALAAIEARTGKILFLRAFRLTLSAWRSAGAQPFPVAPISAVHSLTLSDSAGTVTEIAPGAYRLIADTHRPRLVPAGSCLPMIPERGTAEIEFEAGFGADWANQPADLAQAVMLLAAHYYEYRHDAQGVGQSMPFGVMALVERYRNLRIFMGGGQ